MGPTGAAAAAPKTKPFNQDINMFLLSGEVQNV